MLAWSARRVPPGGSCSGKGKWAVLVGFAVGLALALAVAALAYWMVQRERTAAVAAIGRAQRAERLSAAAADPIFALARDGTIGASNPAAATLLGGDGAVNGEALTALLHPDDRRGFAALLVPSPRATGGPRTAALRLRAAGGDWSPWDVVVAAPADGKDAPAGEVVVRLRDVGEREALREELVKRRLHDPLTGLPTRALLLDRLVHALALAARRAEVLAVFLVDPGEADVPGGVSLSPAARDQLAQGIAQRVQLALRHGDSVARLDDGRYAVLLESLHDVLDAAAVAERILDRFLIPVPAGGVETLVAPRIGISLGGGHEQPDDLLLHAEAALIAASRANQAPYAIFDPSMTAAALDRFGLETELRRAMAANELRLHVQPIVRLRDGGIVAYEAMPVWQHPRSGLVLPADLVALADAAGLTVPLGLWALATACRQSRERQRARPEAVPLVCLDIAPQQFRSAGLAGDVARILHEAGLSPQHLRLEIAQELALEDIGATVTRLLALKGLGVQVAIDGFGTGYAALGFLQRCPVDALKIARSYVAGLGANPDDSAIVQAALAFARGLEIPVVAEGVETAAQRDELRRLGCEFGQGDLFGAPGPLDALASSAAGSGEVAGADGSATAP
jgi:EAL domain-containing protein (putative c-di-GMP-specific phosphodiesterase class I)/GGDEF domain-containing protein